MPRQTQCQRVLGRASTRYRNAGVGNTPFTRSSKLPANVFKTHVLIVGRLLNRVNTL